MPLAIATVAYAAALDALARVAQAALPAARARRTSMRAAEIRDLRLHWGQGEGGHEGRRGAKHIRALLETAGREHLLRPPPLAGLELHLTSENEQSPLGDALLPLELKLKLEKFNSIPLSSPNVACTQMHMMHMHMHMMHMHTHMMHMHMMHMHMHMLRVG